MAVLLGLLLGCGGGVAGAKASDGGSMADSVSSDSSVTDAWGVPSDGGPWSPVCPSAAPMQGTTCMPSLLQCEYGSAWWEVSCDTVMQCVNGQWSEDQLSVAPCFPAPGPNSSSCPTNPASVQKPTTTCPQVGLLCWYGEGAYCNCSQNHQIDGGAPYWQCGPVDPGCPNTRPRIGAACGPLSTLCQYAGCLAEGCIQGVWQQQIVGGGCQ